MCCRSEATSIIYSIRLSQNQGTISLIWIYASSGVSRLLISAPILAWKLAQNLSTTNNQYPVLDCFKGSASNIYNIVFLRQPSYKETHWYLSFPQVSPSIHITTFKNACHEWSSKPLPACNHPLLKATSDCLMLRVVASKKCAAHGRVF